MSTDLCLQIILLLDKSSLPSKYSNCICMSRNLPGREQDLWPNGCFMRWITWIGIAVFWLLTAGYCWLLIAGHLLLVAWLWLLTCWSLAFGRLLLVNCWLLLTAYCWPLTTATERFRTANMFDVHRITNFVNFQFQLISLFYCPTELQSLKNDWCKQLTWC